MPRVSKPALPKPPVKRRRGAKGKDAEGSKAKKTKTEVHVEREQKQLEGQVYSLGTGDVGQLGLGPDILDRARPALVPGHADVVDAVAGGMHSLLLTQKGEVLSFGCNDEGALGRTTSSLDNSEMTPGVVELPEPVNLICGGDSHSAALTASGAVFVWGNFRDSTGPMGLLAANKSEPKPVRIADGIRQIASGSDHLVLLTKDGRLLTLGNGEQGQLGRVSRCFASRGGRKGPGHLLQPKPVEVRKPRGCSSATFDHVWTGSYVTFARMRESGDVYGFGLNNFFQLGVLASTSVGEPVQFMPTLLTSCSGRRWKKLCGGQHHTLLLDEEGDVYAMGRGDYGRLGLGSGCSEQMTPHKVPGLPPCVDIACGDSVSFAVTKEGKVFSWGLGNNGQLGHGDDEDVHEPKLMSGKQISSKKAQLVSGGGQHTLIVATD